MTIKLQPWPFKVSRKLHGTSIVMFAHLRFMQQLQELTGLCLRPNLKQT